MSDVPRQLEQPTPGQDLEILRADGERAGELVEAQQVLMGSCCMSVYMRGKHTALHEEAKKVGSVRAATPYRPRDPQTGIHVISSTLPPRPHSFAAVHTLHDL